MALSEVPRAWQSPSNYNSWRRTLKLPPRLHKFDRHQPERFPRRPRLWPRAPVSRLPHSTSFTSFATSSIPASRFFSDEVEDPAHDRPARQTAAEDQAAQCHEAGHRIHPLLQPEVLDGSGPAADAGHYGADQSNSPLARRARRCPGGVRQARRSWVMGRLRFVVAWRSFP
jgi:hypothetical protein